MDCGLISLVAIGCAFVAIVSLGHSLLVSFRDQLEARYSHRSALARWVVLAISVLIATDLRVLVIELSVFGIVVLYAISKLIGGP